MSRDWRSGRGVTAENPRPLPDQVTRLAGWPTPQARDGTPRGAQGKRFLNPERSNDLPDCIHMIFSNVQMENTGESRMLNPEFSLWLMGFPKGWLD
jgi:hypothetical protein